MTGTTFATLAHSNVAMLMQFMYGALLFESENWGPRDFEAAQTILKYGHAYVLTASN